MSLIIRPLSAEDAHQLAMMLQAQPTEYMQYFIPFGFDKASIDAFLSKAQQDVYIGLFWDNELVGFFMLRGWDAGYETPSYGVTIAQKRAGIGLGKLTLELAKTYCRLRKTSRIMLKVHPNNLAAKVIYEKAGFVQTGIDPRNENLVYHLDLN